MKITLSADHPALKLTLADAAMLIQLEQAAKGLHVDSDGIGHLPSAFPTVLPSSSRTLFTPGYGKYGNSPMNLTPSTNPDVYSLTARSAIPANSIASGVFGIVPQSTMTHQPSIGNQNPEYRSENALDRFANHPEQVRAVPQLLRNREQAVQSAPLVSREADNYFETKHVSGVPKVRSGRSLQNVDSSPESLDALYKVRRSFQHLEDVLHAIRPVIFDQMSATETDHLDNLALFTSATSDFQLNYNIGMAYMGSPHGSGSQPGFAKGKKRMLESEAVESPAKRLDAHSVEMGHHHGSERPSMPTFTHTQSTPCLPIKSRQSTSNPLYPVHQPVSTTPSTDATVAGLHFHAHQTPPLSQSANFSAVSKPRIVDLNSPAGFSMSPLSLSPAVSDPSRVKSLHSAPPTPNLPPNQNQSSVLMQKEVGRSESSVRAVDRLPRSTDKMVHSMKQPEPLVSSITSSEALPAPTEYRSLGDGMNHLPVSLDMAESYPKRASRSRTGTISFAAVGSPPLLSPDEERLLPFSTQGDGITLEEREQMDDIFLDWLADLCNNLDATDSKGESIHQTLMAKKMQKLEDSGEYRPFKFRIQAFTNRFSEELANRGFKEGEIAPKVVRQYLWSQPLISRFNEEGKKAKSKGNHVWTIDAKKLGENKWHFRPFQRRIVQPHSKHARADHLWVWEARIWDPQISAIAANFSSPVLPPWLTWKAPYKDNDLQTELSGIPPADLNIGEIVQDVAFHIDVVADFELHGQVQQLRTAFDLIVTPADPVRSREVSQGGVHLVDPAAQDLADTDMLTGSHHVLAVADNANLGDAQHLSEQPSNGMLLDSAPVATQEATVQALNVILEPSNLLAVEQQAYPEIGPIETALAIREEKIQAYNQIRASVAAIEPIPGAIQSKLAELQEEVDHASENATRVVQQAQTEVLNGLVSAGTIDVNLLPPPHL